jgi:surface carbohydrate biosynthesis protein
MNGPRIALIVDHPQRDLAGIVLTALELCRRGASCYLVPHNVQDQEIWALAPDFVLLNFARRGMEALASALVRAGIGFGVLDTEGAVWDTPDAYSELLWPERGLRDHVLPLCVWGPSLAEHLVTKGFFSERQIRVTGCPRFDFYHRAWRPVLDGHAPDGHQRILINTNFHTVNSRFVSRRLNETQLRDVYHWDEERIATFLGREERAIAGTIAIVDALARDFPDLHIVLRPHPFEKPDTYQQALGHVRHLEINRHGPVQEQISRALAVIQRSCTTALEAAFCGVPALSPQWIDAPVLIPLSEAVSLPCDTYADMRAAVGAILSSTYRCPDHIEQAIARVTREWFSAIDGRAHVRVADAVLSSIAGGRRIDRRLCSRYLYGLNGTRQTPAERIGRLTRRYLGLNPEWSFRHMRVRTSSYWAQSDKAFACADVETIVRRIEAARVDAPAPPCSIALAKDVGECAHGYNSRAIRLHASA